MRVRGGSLVLIGGLLAASAVLRTGDIVGAALALQASQPAPAPQVCAASDTPEVLAALRRREERLAARELALEDRMRALSLAEEQARRRIEELTAAESRLSATLARADTAAEDDLARLTEVYAAMKPKEAAALFEEMDPRFAAGFLGRMPAPAAAAIMAGLSPKTAYSFSVLLAGRNANAPRD